jgi:hypothetical protein
VFGGGCVVAAVTLVRFILSRLVVTYAALTTTVLALALCTLFIVLHALRLDGVLLVSHSLASLPLLVAAVVPSLAALTLSLHEF